MKPATVTVLDERQDLADGRVLRVRIVSPYAQRHVFDVVAAIEAELEPWRGDSAADERHVLHFELDLRGPLQDLAEAALGRFLGAVALAVCAELPRDQATRLLDRLSNTVLDCLGADEGEQP